MCRMFAYILLVSVYLIAVGGAVEMKANATVAAPQARQFEELGFASFPSYGFAHREPMSSGNGQDPWASPLPDYLVKSMNSPRQQKAADGPPATSPNSDSRPVPVKNNYKVAVSCGDDDMSVRMEFERPFHGLVYSKGYFNKPECVFVHGDNRSTVFNFAIGYNTCGSTNRSAQAQASRSTTTTAASTTTSTTPLPTTTTARPTFVTWPTQPVASTAAPRVVQPAFVPQAPAQVNPLFNQQLYQPQQQLNQPQQQYLPSNVNPYAQIPTNLLPTGMLGYPQQQLYNGGYPAQQQLIYPQQGQGYVNNGLLYPGVQNNNLGLYGGVAGYGPLGREMEDDLPAVDMRWVENTLLVQQDANVQDAMDDAKSLQCEWRERYNKKIVTEGYKVEMADVVRASFPGDNVGSYMQIKSGLGPLSPEAKGVIRIGSPLTLVVGLTNSSSKFDLMVHSCYAKSVGTTPSIPLVDENGCVLRDKYLGPFVTYTDPEQHFGGNKVVFAYFQAFKFPDSTEVDVECSVTICRTACPAQCFGRYKGADGQYVSNWTLKDTKKSIASSEDGGGKIQEVGVGSGMRGRSAANDLFSQGRILQALERRLNEVNGPQQREVKVQSGSPFLLNSPKFLQLRELTNDSSDAPVLKKMKRQVSHDSSDVGLRKKLTVIYPSDTVGTKDQFLLVSPNAPQQWLSPTSTQTKPTPFTTTQTTSSATITQTPSTPSTTTQTISSATTPEPTLTSTVDLFPVVKSAPAVFQLTGRHQVSGSPLEMVTQTPVVYTVPDYYQHVCLPLIGLIGAGLIAGLAILGALLCGACMCHKYRRQLKRNKQSFSPIYSNPRPVATPVSRHYLSDI
ncbi:hypothetical protein BV898_02036 [Hypsibius exemplaris]|uniref:ZP domain-containing protein n=1 Tax=Hypsibius exemplaris TaxID=2072580 RepID=A0A1W0X9Y8_HYPEX|nr:hypothetical protein BV898_02036 [Hypsibius exemplaris]